MATRMQQRRGTASQWISTNSGNGPILAAGEIGFESDTNKFKIGDGVNHWVNLTYFTDAASALASINGLVDGAPALLNTLNELAAALNDDPTFFTTVATNLSNHESDTTNVHGILDTDELATKEYVTQEIGNAEVDQAALAGSGLTWDAGAQKFTVDTTLIQERVTGVSDTEIGYLASVTSDIQTQINSKLASADLTEAAQEAVNTALVAGTGLDKTYNDEANTITLDIDSTVATKSFAAGLLTGATKTNITITGDENGLTISAENGVADSTTDNLTEGSTNKYFTDERAQDAIGNILGTGLSYNDATPGIGIDNAALSNYLLDGASGNSYGLIGTSAYLDVKDTNGYNKEIELDIVSVESKLVTDGFAKTSDIAELAQDAIGNNIGTGLTYTDSTGEIKVTPNTYDAYGSASAVAGDLSTHSSDTTDIHGIADTSLLATKAYADAAVAAVVDAAPASLNTLKELATALADDANYATTVNNALAAKAPLASPAFSGTVTGITKAMVGLGSVDNTADTAKPVSDATQTALNLKAPIDSPTFTGTIGGITKSMVGLGNVDNTSDANKPVSTATQAELDLKAPLANPTFTGTVSGVTKAHVGLANVDNTTDANKPVSTATQTALDAKASLSGATFTGSVEVDGNLVVDGDFTVNGTNFAASATSITIEDNLVQIAHQNAGNTVDLGVVVGYNDGAAKHAGIVRDVSTDKWKLFKGVTTEPTTTVDFTQGSLDNLQIAGLEATSAIIGDVSNTELQYLNGVTSGIQSQIDAKLETSTASSTYATIANVDLKAPLANPTFTGTVAGVTKAHVGLGNVDNTSDADKPVSSAAQSALDLKAPLASPTFTGTVTLPTGTVTSGMILDGTIVNADISSSAAIAQSKVSGLTTDLGLKAPLESPALTGVPTAPTAAAGTNTTQVATTAFVGTAVADLVASAPAALNTLNELASALGNDASFSTTITNSLATKAPLANPTFTGTVSGISKSMVGLGNVDNTSDVSKPISNATQTALDLKAPLSAPTFTGTVSLPSTTTIGDVSATEIGHLDGVTSGIQGQLDSKIGSSTAASTYAPLASPTFTGTVSGVTKSHVGLGNVDNTSDANKPVSTATQTALDLKAPLASPAFTGTITLPQGKLTGGSTTVSANTATTVSTVALADFTTMEYTVSIKQGSKIRSSKVLVQTDGTTVDSVEHSILETGGAMTGVNVTAAVSSTNAILTVTITDASTTNAAVKVINTII